MRRARGRIAKRFKNNFLTTLPYRGARPPIRVLLLVSAAGGNTPTASLLDEQVFQTSVLVTEYYDVKVALPAHDVVFNSIGDADICAEGLEAACAVLRHTSRPVINHPLAVFKTGRASNAERLRGLPNVITPRMATVPRRALAGPDAAAVVTAHGFAFPLLLRVPGFHTGRYFTRVESPESLAAAAGELPGDNVWLIEQLDARDGEGLFRKIRVMIVDRKLYPLHLAISRDWKVHYFRADMAESADNRLHDRAFLDDMAGFIGPRGMAALERINAALDLDYGGIDFAVDAAGDILFFEGNATMVMAPLGPDEKWAYRRPAFEMCLPPYGRCCWIARSKTAGRRPEQAPFAGDKKARDFRPGPRSNDVLPLAACCDRVVAIRRIYSSDRRGRCCRLCAASSSPTLLHRS